MQRRPVAAAAARAAGRAAEEETIEPESVLPLRPWHQSIFVRAVLVLLAIFVAIHFYLWAVVATHVRDMNHERLNEHKPRVWESLQRVLDHL